MFKAMLKAINEECGRPGLKAEKVISVTLVTQPLFAQHGIGPAKSSEAMDFVETHCAELYLVETDAGFVLVDYDADDYQFVVPAFGQGGAYAALNYLYETAKDLNEEQDELVQE